MSATRCPDCGRFARYDAYYARNWCDFCDHQVREPVKPESKTTDHTPLREGIRKMLTQEKT